jgi:sigma-B regulation protein RsbU (phosphoserine phosphatase)
VAVATTSIGTRLTLAVSLLVAAIIGGFATLQFLDIEEMYSRTTARTERRLRDNLQLVGTATTEAAAESCRTYFEQANDADMRLYLGQLVRNSGNIAAAYVVDGNQGLVGHSEPAKNPASGHPPVTETTWPAVREALLGAAGEAGKVVGVSLDEAGVSVFARPAVTQSPGGRILHGYVVLVFSQDNLRQALVEIEQEKQAEVLGVLRRSGVVGLLCIAVGIGLASVVGRRTSRPLHLLASQAQEIASGNLAVRVKVSAAREISSLADNFNFMADRIAASLEDTQRRAQIEKELNVARDIQQKLVPKGDLLDYDGLQIAAHYQLADKCGGDWWGVYRLGEQDLLLVIADVTGHGVASAMIAAGSKAACDALVQRGRPSCEELAETMNAIVHESAHGELMMTAFFARFDLAAGRLSWLNAGHNFPFLRTPDGQVRSIGASSVPLGLRPTTRYQGSHTELAPGTLLVFYTDGVIERTDGSRRQYGERRLRRCLQQLPASRVDEVRMQMLADVTSFAGGAPALDDSTLVVVRTGGAEAARRAGARQAS